MSSQWFHTSKRKSDWTLFQLVEELPFQSQTLSVNLYSLRKPKIQKYMPKRRHPQMVQQFFSIYQLVFWHSLFQIIILNCTVNYLENAELFQKTRTHKEDSF